MAAGDLVPYENEVQPVIAEKKGFIPYEEADPPTQAVYLEDKDEIYSYSESLNEDDLNHDIQTQAYGKPKEDFMFGVSTLNPGFKAGVYAGQHPEVLPAFGKGAAAFAVTTPIRMVGGAFMALGENPREPGIQFDTLLETAINPALGIPKIGTDLASMMLPKDTSKDEEMAQLGRDLVETSNKILNDKFFKIGDTTQEQVAFDLGGAGASLLTSVGLFALTKNPNLAAAVFGQIAASDTYIRGREEGATPKEAYGAALMNFVTEGGLEYIGLDRFMKYMRGSKVIARIAAKAGTEFFQEAGQTLGSELSAKMYGFGEDDWGKILQDMFYSGMIGAVMGGAGGSVQVIRENRGLVGKLRAAGLNDKEIDEVISSFSKSMQVDFKQAFREAAYRDMEVLKATPDTKTWEIRDEAGILVTDEEGDMSPEDRFRYKDKSIEALLKAEQFTQGEEKPSATEDPNAKVDETVNLAVQGRINLLTEETDALSKEIAQMETELEKLEGTEFRKMADKRSKAARALQEKEVELYGYMADGAEATAEVEGGKPVTLKAGTLNKARAMYARKQIQKFKEGLKAGKKIAKADIKAFQTFLGEMINSSEVLTDKQKKNMLNSLKTIQNEKSFEKRVEVLSLRIQQLETANAIKVYAEAINTLLNKARDRAFDADTRKVFDGLLKIAADPTTDPANYAAAVKDGTDESRLRFEVALLNSINLELPWLRTMWSDLSAAFEHGVNTRQAQIKAKEEIRQANLDAVNAEISAGKKQVKSDPNARRDTPNRNRVPLLGTLTFDTVINFLTRGAGKKQGATATEKLFDTFKAFSLKTKVQYVYQKLFQDKMKSIYGLKDDAALAKFLQRFTTEKIKFDWVTGGEEGGVYGYQDTHGEKFLNPEHNPNIQDRAGLTYRIENAGDILREISLKGEEHSLGYIGEKLRSIESFLENPDRAIGRPLTPEYIDALERIKKQYAGQPVGQKGEQLALNLAKSLIDRDYVSAEKYAGELRQAIADKTLTAKISEGKITSEVKHSVELTRDEVVKRVMEWQRTKGQKNLANKNLYTQELMDDMVAALSEADMKYIAAQYKLYDELWQIANPVYLKHTGKNLPYDAYYTHLFTEGGDSETSVVDEMLMQAEEDAFFSDITSKDIFRKVTTGTATLREMGAYFAMNRYINDIAHFVGYADLTTNIKELLLAPDTVANLKANYGDKVTKFFEQEFKRLKLGRSATNHNVAWDWVSKITPPMVKAWLSNPTIGVKQLVSSIVYLAEVPPVHYARYISEFIDPLKWDEVNRVLKQFRGDILIQARGDTFEREILAARDAILRADGIYDKGARLGADKYLLGSMRLGDRGAIYLGAYAMYKYDTEVKNMTHEQAMDHFRRFTNKSQQSPDLAQLPSQISDPHPLSRLLTLFKQAPYQYVNLMAQAIFNAKTVSPLETARKLFVYHMLQPLIWQFVANGFNWDDKDELRAAILGPLGNLVIAGDLLTNLVDWGMAKVFDEQNSQWRTNMDLIETLTKKTHETLEAVATIVDEGGVDAETFFTLIQDLAMAVSPVGGAVSGATRIVAGAAKGVVSALEGEYPDAVRRVIGFSDYAVSKGEE